MENKRPTITIKTPIAGHEVLLKEWITGREREYIEEPNLSAIDAKPLMEGKFSRIDISKIDINKMVVESKHREFETFIVSIDGATDDILNKVLEMHEEDTAFIEKSIQGLGKKKDGAST